MVAAHDPGLGQDCSLWLVARKSTFHHRLGESSTVHKPSETHPCVFHGRFVREQVDPRVRDDWEARFGGHAPFGRFRSFWRSEHCQTLNPYESAWCPYSESDCALAFYACVSTTIANARTKRGATGYFRKVAKTMALDRADAKPLAREKPDATPTAFAQGPSDTGAASAGDRAGQAHLPPTVGPSDGDDDPGLRRRLARPVDIGTVLRSLNARPREGPADDGEAGAV